MCSNIDLLSTRLRTAPARVSAPRGGGRRAASRLDCRRCLREQFLSQKSSKRQTSLARRSRHQMQATNAPEPDVMGVVYLAVFFVIFVVSVVLIFAAPPTLSQIEPAPPS